MRLRNGVHGYGAVTKLLHWVTVAAVAAQLLVGWTMDADAAADTAERRVDAFEEGGEERAEADGEAAEERFEREVDRREEAADRIAALDVLVALLRGGGFRDGLDGLEVHLLVGLLVLLLGLVRLGWRRTTPLPPWAGHLSAGERRLEAWLEKVLLGSLLAVPATGLLLLLVDDDLVSVHVAAQMVLLATVVGHVALVLKHTVLHRHQHLSRML